MNSNAVSVSQLEHELKSIIQENHLEVPMLPEVAGKVVALAESPDSDVSELSRLIQGDQVLAGNVMRIANSALYSPSGSLVSLQQAITRLGMSLISEIALAASINTRLFNAPGYEAHIYKMLKNSLAAALWAKEIARSARKNVEAAFLGGLLHDIGRPVAIQSLVEIAHSSKLELSKEDVYELENKFQREIGIKVVKQWGMPPTVCEVIEYYDRYQEPHNAQFQTMIVVAGGLFAKTLETSSNLSEEEKIEQLHAHEVMAELNFYRDDIEMLMEKGEQVNNTLGAMSP